ncbi:acyl-CoA N-acyltransferase [Mycena crocata]|nr:acyl-CoA N-acyltransferase [Mycena crocata]
MSDNFCYPVPAELRSERVRLAPFNPQTDAELLFVGTQAHPEFFKYLLFSPWLSVLDVRNLVETRVQPLPGSILFSIWNMAPPSSSESNASLQFAGVIGLQDTSRDNLSTEIGFALTLPRFQRTHVTSHAIGVLLHWALDAAPRGLGLRRVAWRANALNEGSRRAAERMGFRFEGVTRWSRVLPAGKAEVSNGRERRAEDARRECVGINTQVLALCWDDWEDGARGTVDAVIARTA